MLTFKETRKSKRDLKIESKSKLNDESKVRKPAWIDKNVQPIVINEQSRLRKLMKTEAETEISGQDYAKRLQEYHAAVHSSASLFQWAKTETSTTKKEEDDPISKLLHSNTSIFDKSDQVLQSGVLKYTKLKPANSSSLH